MIDELLKEHEATQQLMQIDQKGWKQGSLGCVDNLLMDKAINTRGCTIQQEKHHYPVYG